MPIAGSMSTAGRLPPCSGIMRRAARSISTPASGSEIGGVELGSDAGSFNYFNEYLPIGDQIGDYEYSLFVSHVRGDGFQPNSSFTTTTGNILASYTPTADDKITVKVIDNYLGTALPIRLSLNQFNLNPFQRGCSTPFSRSGCASVNLFANGLSGPTVAQTASQAGLGRHDQRTILGARWEHNFDAETTWQTQYVYDNKDINQPTGATSAVGDQPAFNVISGITQRGAFLGLPATHFAQLFFNYVHLSNDTFNVAPGGNARLGALTSYFWGHQYGAGARAREEVQFAPQWTGLVGVGVEYTDLQAVNTINTFASVGAPAVGSPTFVTRNYLNAAPEAALLYRPTRSMAAARPRRDRLRHAPGQQPVCHAARRGRQQYATANPDQSRCSISGQTGPSPRLSISASPGFTSCFTTNSSPNRRAPACRASRSMSRPPPTAGSRSAPIGARFPVGGCSSPTATTINSTRTTRAIERRLADRGLQSRRQ